MLPLSLTVFDVVHVSLLISVYTGPIRLVDFIWADLKRIV